MGSTRLPGKIAQELDGAPVLHHVVKGLANAKLRRGIEVLVATTASQSDDDTESICKNISEVTRCVRGPDEDVLARYVLATEDLPDSAIVIRATADNTLYCPMRTAQIIERHIESGCDYTCVQDLSYVVPEVMRVGALRAMERLATETDRREHVTPYFRSGQSLFKTEQLPPNWQALRPDIDLTIDTRSDLQRLRGIYEAIHINHDEYTLSEVYSLCDSSSFGKMHESP